MTRVIVDVATAAKLRELRESLELCDEGGKVLGRFTPLEPPLGDPRREPQISEEEMDRRERSTEPRRTTAEVLAHLEQLACSESSGTRPRSTS